MYSYLKTNFDKVNEEISTACKKAGRELSSVKLITVTKTYTVELLKAVMDLGYKAMGENRPQEVMEKAPDLDGTQELHLIGQLQTNKVKKVVPLVDWIHSVDREKLLNKIESTAEELSKPINILVQVNTSGEASKSGCLPSETFDLCKLASEKKWVKLRGLMTIGPLHGDSDAVRKSFSDLKELGDSISHLVEDNSVELSMGMSGDFAMAIEEGSTMIRVGSKIVGNRSYN